MPKRSVTPERIREEDLLAVPKIGDLSSPWFTYVTLPPVIMAEMQCIMYTTLLRLLVKKVLDKLSIMVLSNNRKNWMGIYLTIFLSLHSYTMMIRRNEEFARQINLSVGNSVFLPHPAAMFN